MKLSIKLIIAIIVFIFFSFLETPQPTSEPLRRGNKTKRETVKKGNKPIPLPDERKPGKKNRPRKIRQKTRKINKAGEKDLVSLDFDSVDIKVILKFMSELTNRNFLISEKVRGKVTILSPKKISPEDAYKVLESILEVHGFAAVPSGEIVKIVPTSEGKSRAIETKIGREKKDLYKDDRLVTQLIPMDYADANEIKNILAPLISKNSNIIAYPPTNTLILTDISSNISRLVGIIKELDIETIEFIISVIPLIHASSDDLASMILSVIEASTMKGKAGRGKKKRVPSSSKIGKKGLKVVSDSRTNSLIVVATPQDTKRIKSLIQKLDVEVPRPESKIRVYYLENAVAEEMANVLSGPAAQLVKEKSTYKGAGKGKVRATGRAGRDNITITPDKATNSLVIAASPEDYQALKEVIQKLDIPRSQVLVEAVILEVSFSRSREFGTEVRTMDDPTKGGIRTFGGTNLPPNTINSITAALAQGIFPGDSGLILGLSRGLNVGVVIRAMQANSDVNILSTPSILTMDNQEAEIIIGQERPFLTRSQTDTTGASITNSFDFKDVGITLRITPHITRGKYVRLELFQEIKDFVSEDPDVVGAVTTTKRQAKTTVVVEDRETVVIGGLISDNNSKGVAQVPCLGNMPLFGWLFKTLTTDDRKTNLMIFITPYIVNNPEDLKQVTIEKKLEMDRNIKEQRIKKKEDDIQDNVDLMTE